jgi:hypothetical protein
MRYIIRAAPASYEGPGWQEACEAYRKDVASHTIPVAVLNESEAQKPNGWPKLDPNNPVDAVIMAAHELTEEHGQRNRVTRAETKLLHCLNVLQAEWMRSTNPEHPLVKMFDAERELLARSADRGGDGEDE